MALQKIDPPTVVDGMLCFSEKNAKTLAINLAEIKRFASALSAYADSCR